MGASSRPRICNSSCALATKEFSRLRHLARVSNKRFDTAEAQHARGDEIARLMRGFLSPAAPAVLPITNSYRAPFKRPPPDRVELFFLR